MEWSRLRPAARPPGYPGAGQHWASITGLSCITSMHAGHYHRRYDALAKLEKEIDQRKRLIEQMPSTTRRSATRPGNRGLPPGGPFLHQHEVFSSDRPEPHADFALGLECDPPSAGNSGSAPPRARGSHATTGEPWPCSSARRRTSSPLATTEGACAEPPRLPAPPLCTGEWSQQVSVLVAVLEGPAFVLLSQHKKKKKQTTKKQEEPNKTSKDKNKRNYTFNNEEQLGRNTQQRQRQSNRRNQPKGIKRTAEQEKQRKEKATEKYLRNRKAEGQQRRLRGHKACKKEITRRKEDPRGRRKERDKSEPPGLAAPATSTDTCSNHSPSCRVVGLKPWRSAQELPSWPEAEVRRRSDSRARAPSRAAAQRARGVGPSRLSSKGGRIPSPSDKSHAAQGGPMRRLRGVGGGSVRLAEDLRVGQDVSRIVAFCSSACAERAIPLSISFPTSSERRRGC